MAGRIEPGDSSGGIRTNRRADVQSTGVTVPEATGAAEDAPAVDHNVPDGPTGETGSRDETASPPSDRDREDGTPDGCDSSLASDCPDDSVVGVDVRVVDAGDRSDLFTVTAVRRNAAVTSVRSC